MISKIICRELNDFELVMVRIINSKYMKHEFSKLKIFAVFYLVLSLVATINCYGALSGTYYIDATNGNDLLNGKTEANAWKTFNNINKTTLFAGTKILLKKGCVWNQRLEIKGAGTVSNWITVGSYGTSADRPKISLTNHPDDIGILICDLDRTSGMVRQQNISYIEIKGLEISNTRLGIYYRAITSTINTGFRVKDVIFNNINCDPVMTAINSAPDKNAEITAQLAAVKGNLGPIDTYSSGGAYEYIFPAAIFIGGKTFGPQRVNGNHITILTELEVSDCEFNEAIAGLMSVFYWPFVSGDGANVWRQLIYKVKLNNCTATGIVNGMLGIDGVNGGAVPDANGVMQPDANGWGLVKNVRVLKGSDQPGRTWPNGTTGVIFSNCQNFLIDSCEFSNVLNQGNPDGCGFDFESNTNQVTIQNTKFFNNDGHSILLMNGGNFGGNTNLVLQKNIFANNVANSNSAYELNLGQQYDGSGVHQNVKIRNNIVFMRKKNKDNVSIGFYKIDKRAYVTATDNDLYYLEPSESPIAVSFLGELYNFNAQVSSVSTPVVSAISISRNAADPSNHTVTIFTEITKGSPSFYMASENASFTDAAWLTYNSMVDFAFSPGTEIKTVYFKVMNASGISSPVYAFFDPATSINNINEITENQLFVEAFPNPVSSVVNIKLISSISGEDKSSSKSDKYEVALMNYNGKIIEQSTREGRLHSFDLSCYPPGMYLIRITEARKVYTKIIVKD